MRNLLPALPPRVARLALGAAAALIGVAGLVAIPAGTRAAFDDVTPGSGFQGEVNLSGVSGATVVVVCPSPGDTVGTVHAGQTVNIFTDATPGGPRTGLTDTYVDEWFDGFPTETIRITKYGQQNKIEIPTTFHAPCSGSGKANFKPGPGSGGVSDVVNLFFVRVAS